MISEKAFNRLIARLSTLKYFPAKKATMVAVIGESVLEYASTDEEVEWLGKRMLTLYAKWPGPLELRAVFCSKFQPRDGIDVSMDTEG